MHVCTYIDTYIHTCKHANINNICKTNTQASRQASKRTVTYIHTYIHTHTCILTSMSPYLWVYTRLIMYLIVCLGRSYFNFVIIIDPSALSLSLSLARSLARLSV